jgi:hypothetical protein
MKIKATAYVPEIFFGALLAVAVFAMGGVFWSSGSQPTANKPATKSEEKSGGTQQDEALWHWVSHDASGFFTLVLAIIGGFQLGLFVWQLRLIRKSLDEAKVAGEAAKKSAEAAALNAQAVINAERARIFISIRPLETNVVPGILQARAKGDGTLALRISYVFKNHGKTPAIVRGINHSWAVRFDQPRGWNLEPVVDLPVHMIGAGATSPAIKVYPVIEHSAAHQIANFESTFWFKTEMIYDDTFERNRVVWFIWHYGAECPTFSLFNHGEAKDEGE